MVLGFICILFLAVLVHVGLGMKDNVVIHLARLLLPSVVLVLLELLVVKFLKRHLNVFFRIRLRRSLFCLDLEEIEGVLMSLSVATPCEQKRMLRIALAEWPVPVHESTELDFSLESSQIQQFLCCFSADQLLDFGINRCLINPATCCFDVFIGVIRRKHDPLRTEIFDGTLQCCVIADA